MITKSVFLPLSPAAAFTLFTEQISMWWPEDRRHTKDPESQLFILPTGRFFEVARNGEEVELGKVTVWDAPHRLVLDFYIATGKQAPTEASITFTKEAGGTRVTVVHRSKPESEHLWNDRAPRYSLSWQAVLDALARASQQRID